MRKRIVLTPSQAKKINRAVKEYKAFKQMDTILKDYNGKSFKILRVKQIVKSKLKQKWK